MVVFYRYIAVNKTIKVAVKLRANNIAVDTYILQYDIYIQT